MFVQRRRTLANLQQNASGLLEMRRRLPANIRAEL